jgi:hypothetical protein
VATTATRGPRGAETARSWAPQGLDETAIRVILAAAMVAAAAVSLWFTRDTSFSLDELNWFSTSAHLDFRGAIEPYNGHLIAITRLVYAAIFNVFGAGYLPFRLLTIGSGLLTAGLFFVFARRRIGPLAALAPTLVLLFFGAGSEVVLSGNGFTWQASLAAGLGALLVLDREDLAGDIGACLLLCFALAAYSVGVALLAGAAVLILLGRDRWRRAWVFLIPALLYAAWLLWSLQIGGSNAETRITVSNLLLAPNWGLDSLAGAGVALLGIGYDFKTGGLELDTSWGPVVASVGLIALGRRLWRGSIQRWLWATLAVAVVFWVIGAAAETPLLSGPQNPRYIYPASLVVLLVAVEAARGVRFGRRGIVILYALVAISLSTNIIMLRNTSRIFRIDAITTRAYLAGVDAANGRVGLSVADDPLGGVLRATGRNGVATGYLDAVREFGSPAFSLPELRGQTEPVREKVDSELADNLGLGLQPSGGAAGHCRRISGNRGEGTSFKLAPGGAVLRASGAPAPLLLRRFGTAFSVDAGQLQPGAPEALPVPRDSTPDPWYAQTPLPEVALCGPPG